MTGFSILALGLVLIATLQGSKASAIEWGAARCVGHEWDDIKQVNLDYLLPHEDCTKFWYCTASGDAYEYDCPTPLHFSPTVKRCEWQEIAGCANGTTSTSTAASTISSTTASPPSSSIPPSPSVAPPAGICDGFTGTNPGYLQPHKDCTKFWSCAPFGPVEMNCSGGLHFNPSLKVCDWPSNAGCTGGAASSTTTAAPPSTPPPPPPPPPPATGVCDGHEWTLATHDSNDWLQPHDDCTKFWSCPNGGGSVAMDCPAALHFNPSTKMCDWPAVAGCQ